MNRRARRASASAARQGRETAAAPAPGRPAGVAPAPDSPAAQLYRAVSETGRATAGAILASGRTVQAVHTVVERAAALGDAYMARSPTDPSLLACKKGCNACCSRPVGTTAPSVLRLVAWLREHRTAEELAEVHRRVVALDDVTHGKTWTPRERPPNPCALLVDGACSVYQVRPFVCRAWNAVDAEDCKRTTGQDGIEMRFDLYQRAVFAAVEDGVKLALSDAGLDGGDLELTASLRAALERPDAGEAWLAGEPVFAGCEAKPPGGRRRLPLAP
jgi:Fe-S-cluster containining protein